MTGWRPKRCMGKWLRSRSQNTREGGCYETVRMCRILFSCCDGSSSYFRFVKRPGTAKDPYTQLFQSPTTKPQDKPIGRRVVQRNREEDKRGREDHHVSRRHAYARDAGV